MGQLFGFEVIVSTYGGEINIVNTSFTSATYFSYVAATVKTVNITCESATQLSPQAQLLVPSSGISKYYQMQGYYAAGNVYEVWVDVNTPTNNPPSGHVLQDVEVAATWSQ